VLVGRERECTQIDQLLAEARARRSASLVIRGDAGIGKSALLRYAEGRAKGMQVLRVTGVESDSELPFAALHELLLPMLDLAETLPRVERAALMAAFANGAPTAPDRLAVHSATFAVLAKAADESPLLCLIDDAHWLDSASADSILYACRRLNGEGIVVLLAAREHERKRFEAPGVADLKLEGLRDDAAHALLQRGGLTLAPVVAQELIRTTCGNPLALMKLREVAASAGLSAHELQVALLVARGATNREVGTRLGLSPRTIEFHLRNVYAKVGVRSRTELASRLTAEGAKMVTWFVALISSSVDWELASRVWIG
jgi:DNA-binding NarL/FixJ family response regulator